MTDVFGADILIGDKVLYSTGGGYAIGEVVELKPDKSTRVSAACP